MFGKLIVLALVVFVHRSECLKIPSYFKLCARTDPKFNECARRHGQDAIPFVVKGDRKYRIPEMNPLIISQLGVNNGKNLNVQWFDIHIHGIETTKIKSVNFDFKNRKISLAFVIPKAVLDGQYEISGRILVLPINGKGPIHLELYGLQFTYSLGYDVIKKGNEEYMKPGKGDIQYSIEGMKVRMENLFNGDKLLGEETNNFLNENWKEVSDELGPAIAEALGEIVHLLLSNVCELVPFKELFPEKISN